MSTAFRPRDFEASINIYCKKRIISLSGLCCNKVSINELNQNTNNFIKLKKFSEEVPSGYGISHRRVFQKIIDYELKKKNLPMNAYDSLSTIKLINMMYKSFDKKKWILFKEKNLISKLGK
tara:strand:- start:139 stop:501 length:363 start_codon:yes stop_codon:yes gene_type:complete